MPPGFVVGAAFCLLRVLTIVVFMASVPAGFAPIASAVEPIALRITNFAVTPAHLPGVLVWARNAGDEPYAGTIRLELPDGWTASPETQDLSLQAGGTGSVRFTIRNGRTRPENRYQLTALAVSQGREVRHDQEVLCTSAPYFQPVIDGEIDDWVDAIPATFTTGGKKTTISTFWSRRHFSMLVAVEEDELTVPGAGRAGDAVQIAISPQGAQTPTTADAEATRYEFLLVAEGAGQPGRCFLLAEPGMQLAETQAERPLADLELEDARPVVTRRGTTTYYEWAVPFRMLAAIRPGEGREFFLSILVHDPGGTGLRDWGEAAGLWPEQRNSLAWSRWPGAGWRPLPPMDNKVEWGMCSSKY